MNIVVTGATSFLGAALVKELLRREHQVFAVVRPGSKNRQALDGASGAHIVELPLERLEELDQYVPVPCQLFFHFGWDGSGSENRMKREVQQKNVTDSMKALEGARKLGCKRFFFSGSQAEYGIYQEAMTEDLECHPVSEYGKAKVEFCRQAKARCEQWKQEQTADLEYVHLRIFSVYGPGDHPWSLVNTCLDRFLHGQTMELGVCTQQWNFLYIEDLIQGLLALAFCERPLDDVYNLAGGEESTMMLRRYVEKMHELCGSCGNFHYGTLGLNAEGPANLIPDIQKIQQATGWKPVITFEEGIKRMLKEKKRGCLICGHALPEKPLMEFAQMPASAQNIPDAEQVKDDTGVDLHLHQCPNCGLVQFDCTPVSYYRDVIRSGGFSTTMVELRRYQYRHLIETYHLEGKKFLEAGCGRGEFLSVLTEFPVEAYGIEHKADLVALAKEQALSVTEGFTETADTVLGDHGPYDVFLSFNFLEHQPNPGVMLDCIYNNLTDDGMGLITVPSFEYILQYDGYYELIRDHIAYYSFETLRYLLELHGFEVLEEEIVNRDTCSVIVRKRKGWKEGESYEAVGAADASVGTQKKAGAAGEAMVKPVDLSGWRASKEEIQREIRQLSDRLKQEGKTLAVWGASHQGFTLAATTCLGETAEYMMDSAPFKQGRFAPASHLPIVKPEHYLEHPVDTILIVAPGYTKEIAGSIRSRFGEQVEILTLRSDHLEKVEELS